MKSFHKEKNLKSGWLIFGHINAFKIGAAGKNLCNLNIAMAAKFSTDSEIREFMQTTASTAMRTLRNKHSRTIAVHVRYKLLYIS